MASSRKPNSQVLLEEKPRLSLISIAIDLSFRPSIYSRYLKSPVYPNDLHGAIPAAARGVSGARQRQIIGEQMENFSAIDVLSGLQEEP